MYTTIPLSLFKIEIEIKGKIVVYNIHNAAVLAYKNMLFFTNPKKNRIFSLNKIYFFKLQT
jgi:hypothetical protein